KTFRQTVQAFVEAMDQLTDESLHEARKQAKYLRHQFEILCPIQPAVVNPLIEQSKKLGDLLGDDHDLVVLRDTLNNRIGQFGQEAVDSLLELAARRRPELQEEARKLGELLLNNRPRDVERKLQCLWKTWRRQPELA